MILQDRLELAKNIYLRDDRTWIVGYSGGKDSTAVLQILWLALRELSADRRQKPVHICYVDTGMDHPAYAERVLTTISTIEAAARAQGMPFLVNVLQPELQHRYFVAVIGRGYAPPTHWFRWCTRQMRIRPMTKFVRTKLVEKKEIIIALGLRSAESAARGAILAKYKTGTPFLGTYGALKGALAFTPIEDFDTADVWQFLMQTSCPWGQTNQDLAKLYSLASGGECPTISLGDSLGSSCGGSRFGCWTCTVVRKDQAGRGLAEDDERYEHLLEFRNWLSTIRYDRKRRWKKRRNGAPGPGPLTLETRREILCRLGAVQVGTGFNLLRADELKEIQRLWNLDGDRKSTAFALWPLGTGHQQP